MDLLRFIILSNRSFCYRFIRMNISFDEYQYGTEYPKLIFSFVCELSVTRVIPSVSIPYFRYVPNCEIFTNMASMTNYHMTSVAFFDMMGNHWWKKGLPTSKITCIRVRYPQLAYQTCKSPCPSCVSLVLSPYNLCCDIALRSLVYLAHSMFS